MTRTAEEPRPACLLHGVSRRRPGLLVAASALLISVGALGCGSTPGDADEGTGSRRDGGSCGSTKTNKQRVSDAGAQRVDAGAPRADAGAQRADAGAPAAGDDGTSVPAGDQPTGDQPTGTGSTGGSGTVKTLLEENFEKPLKPIALTCDSLLNQDGINELYGKAGFSYMQNFTVEAVLLKDNKGDYRDAKGSGGKYAVGMMSDGQDDALALTFKPDQAFLNVSFDIAAVELKDCGVNLTAEEPRMTLTLYKTPATGFTFTARGERLQEVTLRGRKGRSARTFEWTEVTGALEAARAAGQNVTLVFDATGGGYVVFDNLVIAESDKKFAGTKPTNGGSGEDDGDDDGGDGDDSGDRCK